MKACNLTSFPKSGALQKYVVFLLAIAWPIPGYAQSEWENLEFEWLQQVMPGADSFAEKRGEPPVIEAYTGQGEDQELIGYVFTTPDLPPEEIGYSGTIDLLAGIDLAGQITGVKALHYLESHRLVRGDFITDSGFLNQLAGKSIGDEFRPGEDIDGMSRATITSWAVARGLRNAARRVAMAYLPDSSFAVEVAEQSNALEALQQQSWDDMLNSGYVRTLTVPVREGGSLTLSFAYMGHFLLGELLIGSADYSNADRTASGMIEDGHMMLVGLSGSTSRLQQLRLGAMQDGVLYPNTGDRVVFAGTAGEGKIAGQVQMAVALFLDARIDITRPFALLYDLSESRGAFEETVSIEYQLPTDVMALLQGQSVESGNATSGRRPAWGDFIPAVVLLAALALGLRLILRTRQGPGSRPDPES